MPTRRTLSATISSTAAPKTTTDSSMTMPTAQVSKKPSNSTTKRENGALKSCLSSSSISCSAKSLKKSVSFHQVEIREYERIVGDNPAVSAGNAVSLAWQHHSSAAISFSEYEASRPPRRTPQEFQMPARVRHLLLKETGATDQEMNQAHYQIKKTQQHRRASVANQEFEGALLVMESIGRKWKRGIPKKKKKSEVLLHSESVTTTTKTKNTSNNKKESNGSNKKNGIKSKSDKKKGNGTNLSKPCKCSREANTLETDEIEAAC